MPKLIALKSFTYATRHLVADDAFEASNRDARVLVAVKRAKLVTDPAPAATPAPARIPEPVTAPVAVEAKPHVKPMSTTTTPALAPDVLAPPPGAGDSEGGTTDKADEDEPDSKPAGTAAVTVVNTPGDVPAPGSAAAAVVNEIATASRKTLRAGKTSTGAA